MIIISTNIHKVRRVPILVLLIVVQVVSIIIRIVGNVQIILMIDGFTIISPTFPTNIVQQQRSVQVRGLLLLESSSKSKSNNNYKDRYNGGGRMFNATTATSSSSTTSTLLSSSTTNVLDTSKPPSETQQQQQQQQQQFEQQSTTDVPKSIQQELEEWLVSSTTEPYPNTKKTNNIVLPDTVTTTPAPPPPTATTAAVATNTKATASTMTTNLGVTTMEIGRTIESSKTTTTQTSNNDDNNTKTTTTRTTTTNEKKKTVATVFGQPIDISTKERNHQLVHTLKGYIFDVLYSGTTIDRSYARFYALETIARMPYFSYLSVLHLYETLGLWRQCDELKIHFCESWNELHHLLIMESLLNNNVRWVDRFIAQHIAFVYYWIVVVLFMYNPVIAYNLNQNVEEEAYETYNNFLNKNEKLLQTLPAPPVAIDYYTNPTNLYMFDSMHHSIILQNENGKEDNDRDNTNTMNNDVIPNTDQQQQQQQQQSTEEDDVSILGRRRPQINNLYDVFVAIRDDEMEHAKTMEYYQH